MLIDIIDKIYKAELPYFGDKKDKLYEIIVKSIQFHPLNRVYDGDFISNLYAYNIENIDFNLLKLKSQIYSSIALLDNIPISYTEEYIDPSIFNISPYGYNILNTNMIFNGFFTHIFSGICETLNEAKKEVLISSIIERKPVYNFKLSEVVEPKENTIYVNQNYELTYYIENVKTDDKYYEIVNMDKPNSIYMQKPKKQNIYGNIEIDNIDIENQNPSIINTAIALPYVSSKVRDSIRYPDLTYHNSNNFIIRILKSDITTILSIKQSFINYAYTLFRLDSSTLFPLSYRNNADLDIPNVNNLNSVNSLLFNNIFLVKDKSVEFPYTILYDANRFTNYIVYEYDIPPITEIANNYISPILILRYKPFEYLILLYKVNTNDIINILNLNNNDYSIINFNSNISIIHYRAKNINQYDTIKIEIINQENISNKYNINFTFKRFESIVPFTIYNRNIIGIPIFNNLTTLTYYNNINEFITKNINILAKLKECDNTVMDNVYYHLSNETKSIIANAFNIWNFENYQFTDKIFFIL